MNITPLDIRKKEFRKSMRGCDVDEVETFLLDVSEYLEKLITEKENLRTENELLIKEKISSAKKSKSEEKYKDTSDVRKEAELILRDAELKGIETIEKKRVELNLLHKEIAALREQKNSFVKRLKRLFTAQLDLIDVLEDEEVALDKIKNIHKHEKRKKINFDQIEKVPSYKRNVQEKYLNTSPVELSSPTTDEIRKNDTDILNFDLKSIKQVAKEILDDKVQSTKPKPKQDDIDLDSILGKIGEIDT